ncbi:MAG: hypothetical protein WBG24_07770, partial [Syntrophobacteria bacterium]
RDSKCKEDIWSYCSSLAVPQSRMAGLGLVLAEAFSRHFMAVSLLKMHQIFMLAFTGLRVEGEGAQVLVVSQPPPLAFPGVSAE